MLRHASWRRSPSREGGLARFGAGGRPSGLRPQATRSGAPWGGRAPVGRQLAVTRRGPPRATGVRLLVLPTGLRVSRIKLPTRADEARQPGALPRCSRLRTGSKSSVWDNRQALTTSVFPSCLISRIKGSRTERTAHPIVASHRIRHPSPGTVPTPPAPLPALLGSPLVIAFACRF